MFRYFILKLNEKRHIGEVVFVLQIEGVTRLSIVWIKYTQRKIAPLYTKTVHPPVVHCKENHIYVFLFWELRGLSPNITFMCL